MFLPVRLGLIGAGKWGKNYISTIKNLKNVDLVHIASKNLKVEDVNLANCLISRDWQRVIDSRNIDGIIIATNPATHAEIAKTSIKAGFPTLVEKPLTLGKLKAEELLTIARENNSIVKVDHIHLFHPGFRRLKKISKVYDNLISINSIGGNFGPFRKDINSLWDWGPHDLAMCIEIIGDIPLNYKVDLVRTEKVNGVKGENIDIELRFKKNIKAILKIGNLFEKKTRCFSLNYNGCSFIYDPINLDRIGKIDYGETESVVNKSTDAEILTYSKETPLEIIVKEFADDILKNNVNFKELELSVNVVTLLEDISKKLNN